MERQKVVEGLETVKEIERLQGVVGLKVLERLENRCFEHVSGEHQNHGSGDEQRGYQDQPNCKNNRVDNNNHCWVKEELEALKELKILEVNNSKDGKNSKS